MHGEKVYFNRGRFKVTGRALRTPTRTFQIRHIEKTQIRRPALVFGLGITAACAGFVWSFEDLLYHHEVQTLLIAPAVATLITSRFAVLVISTKALGREVAAFGLVGSLKRVREALDSALDDHSEIQSQHAPWLAYSDDWDADDIGQ